MNDYLRPFSHIYVEQTARDHVTTQSILSRYAKATVVEIDHYKQLFNRSLQDPREQEHSKKLILATRRDDFVYGGSHFTPSFENTRFFYNTMVLGCLYSCQYCYLQGMFQSADIVMFINVEDFLAHTEKLLHDGPLYLCISYDTDLLLFEHLIPYCRRWVEFAQKHPDVTIELRTKSTRSDVLLDLEAPSNFIFAWSLSPSLVTSEIELKTPSLDARLAAIKRAQEKGWSIRLCFDPIIACSDWRDIYGDFIEHVFSELAGIPLRDLSLGSFRMNSAYLKRIKSRRTDLPFIHQPFEVKNGVASYGSELENEVLEFVFNESSNFIDAHQIHIQRAS